MSTLKETLLLSIIAKEQLGQNTYLLKLKPKESNQQLPPLKAGQFVQVLPPGGLTLLRRPISVCHYLPEYNELWLLIASIGRGTRAITDSALGDSLDIILPLGNTFDPSKSKQPLLIGGGVGIAPMLALAHTFTQQGIRPTVLLGGRSAEYIVLQEAFAEVAEIHITTDDGSLGIKGRVTDHPYFHSENYDYIYTCGPQPMMRAIAQLAEQRGIGCEVSLENTMACGIGACLCCVQDTHEEGNVCVCTEGPVFESREIIW